MIAADNRPIGIFDSGVGGLTVVKSMRAYLPGEDLIYFGDTARVPYGNKSPATIKRFAREIMGFMMEKRVKMVVVACNTASSLALDALQREYRVPLVGVISPGAEEAARVSPGKRIGVIGTPSTIASNSYARALGRIDRSCLLFSESCPLFVPLVENRLLSGTITSAVVKKYLAGLKKKNIDTLILGCTHYPLLRSAISREMKGVRLVDSAASVARTVKQALVRSGRGSVRKRGTVKYFVSDDPDGFRETARIFLREKIDVKKVSLWV